MCCLFGMIDYGSSLTVSQRNHVISVLSKECEIRGTDATGIAYNHDVSLRIFKRPLPARKMWWRLKSDASVVMGHTRMTTQGSEKFNRNNHPFRGNVNGEHFALAHNGMLYNDKSLRLQYNLPKTDIETDSYIAVQMIEKSGRLSYNSLAEMAEQLEGSFTITVLDEKNNLYFIKGSNPMCIYHWKERGLYLYASTEEILQSALKKISVNLGKAEKIPIESGEILRIDSHGQRKTCRFRMQPMFSPYYTSWYREIMGERSYIDELKSLSGAFGYSADDVDELLETGITPEEIEDWFYFCGEKV